MRLTRTLLITAGFAAYLACAAYLLLRAEGYSFNRREARFVETGIVAVQLTRPASVTLEERRGAGTDVSFTGVAPGRHLLRITTPEGRTAQAVVHAEPRRAAVLDRVYVPGAPLPAGDVLHEDVRAAELSPDRRRLAVLSGADGATLEILNVLATEPERLVTVPLPTPARNVYWAGNELLALRTDTGFLLVRGSGELHPTDAPPDAELSPPGGPLLALLPNGDVRSLTEAGLGERMAEGVQSFVPSADGEPLLARGGALLTLRGDEVLPPLPPGATLGGAGQAGGRTLAWDKSGQGWQLRDDGTWIPGLTDLHGILPGPDGTPVLLGTGTLRTATGSVLLTLGRPIDDVHFPSTGRALVQSGDWLLDCSLTLRSCVPLRSGVTALWRTHGRLLLLERGVVRRVPMD